MDDDFHGSTGYETDDTIDSYGIHGGYGGSDVYFGYSDGPDDSPLDEESDDVVGEESEYVIGGDKTLPDPVLPTYPDTGEEEYEDPASTDYIVECIASAVGLGGIISIYIAIKKWCKK